MHFHGAGTLANHCNSQNKQHTCICFIVILCFQGSALSATVYIAKRSPSVHKRKIWLWLEKRLVSWDTWERPHVRSFATEFFNFGGKQCFPSDFVCVLGQKHFIKKYTPGKHLSHNLCLQWLCWLWRPGGFNQNDCISKLCKWCRTFEWNSC